MKRILSSILVVAMLFTLIPVTFAETYDYVFSTGALEYELKVGETVDVPVYLTKGDGSAVDFSVIQFTVSIPEGLSASNETITDGLLSGYNVEGSKIILMQEKETTSTATDALITITYTALKEGTYTIDFVDDLILTDADYNELPGTVGGVSASVVVKEDAPASEYDYVFRTGAANYELKVGETVDVPVYLTKGDGSAVDFAVIQFTVSIPEGLSASNETITDGLLSGYNVEGSKIILMQEKETTSTATDALITITYTALKEGTYTIDFVDDLILTDADYNELPGTVGGESATITVTAGSTPVVPTLTGITANITEFEVPYGADALTAVKAAITEVKANYDNNTSEVVTDYTVALEGAALAVVEYKGFKAEIALTYEPAPAPTLTGIEVTPDELTVPVEFQSDVKTYVQDKITKVVATYSDNSTAEVQTGYEVTVDGTTATVTYEGMTDTITLTMAQPEPPVSEYDYVFRTGAANYELKVGETVDVPVYLTKGDGSAVDFAVIQFTVSIPEGLSASNETITDGLLSGYNVEGSKIILMQEKETTSTATDALITITYTALKEGTYTIDFVDDLILTDADYNELPGTVGGEGATITVTAGEGGETPVEPTLASITVNPTAVEVPYGADAKVTVEDAIQGVTAVYSDGTTAAVTGWDVEISADGSKAIVTYQDKTAEIALTYGAAPVTDVEIVVAVTEITVPYGTAEADVEAVAKAGVGEVKVKDSKGDERVVEATVAYDAANSVVTVSYGELTPVQIPVHVVTVASYSLAEDTPASIEIPYDVTDVNEYVANKIKVVANLTDGTSVPYADFTVDAGEAKAIVMVNNDVIGEIAVTYAEPPVAEIVDIKVEVAKAIVVPYGVEDINAYIHSVITVKTVDENGAEAATEAYTVEADDGVATVTYGELSDTVDYSLETATLTASVASIEIPYTVAEADYAAYIASKVTVAVDYSADTADQTIKLTADMIELDNGIAVITALETEVPVEVPYTVQAAPEYILEVVTSVYGLEGKSLVKITGVADGKVAVVNGENATYFGNGVFAAVVDAEYEVELAEVAAMPQAAIFGKLHEAGVSAWDALVTNDEALQKDVDVFADNIQNYVLADFDGNGVIEAFDAYNINQISLYQTDGVLPGWAQ